ncbi:carboxy terminal-processing peptidase [soil metagenome]
MPRFDLLRPKGIITILGVAIGVSTLVGAQAPAIDPTELDQQTAQIVAALIERGHLSKPTIDDEISKEWHQQYIKGLDPQKLYFTKADIEEFSAFAEQLDDLIREGDLSFAVKVFDRFKKRHAERLETVMKLLDGEFDFSVEETFISDSDLRDYPADEADALDRWRKELKYQLLVKKINDIEDEEAVRQLKVRYRDIARNVRLLDSTDMLEAYLTSLATAIDPHSSYLGAKSMEDMLDQGLQLQLEGIGASLSVEDGLPTVQEIIAGGAADKDARLKPQDKIVGVEKDDGEFIDFAEKKLSDVVRDIRGPRGTTVRLIVQPAGSKERKTYEIVREKIELADQRAKGSVFEVDGAEGKVVKIGVIDLPSFYGDTAAVRRGDPDAVSATSDCERLLKGFKEQGVDAVLLDLRRNGGGFLAEAIKLTGLFIESGPVVQVRDAQGVLSQNDDSRETVYDGPLAVLISRQSASASEILAGVIKDYGRGLIVGDSSTFGKGTVQTIIDVNSVLRLPENAPNLGAVKLTIQQFYRANGESTQVRGVPPHLHIPSLLDHLDHLVEGEMAHALAFDKVDPEVHDQYNRVPADLLAQLESRSLERRKESTKFQRLNRAIEKMVERKNRHEIPLKEEKFRAEYKSDDEDDPANLGPDGALNVDEEGEDKDAGADRKKKGWDPENYYNQEVLTIVADYVTLGSNILAAAPVRVRDNGNNRNRN